MSTSDFVTFSGYFQAVRSAGHDTRSALQARLGQVEAALDALGTIGDIKDSARTLDQLAEGLKVVMKLVSKIGPLKALAQPINQVLDAVEKKAERAHDFAQRLEQRLEPLAKGFEARAGELKWLIAVIGTALDELDSVAAGVGDTALALAQTHGRLGKDFDAAIAETAGPLATAIAAASAIEQHIRQVNTALQSFAAPFEGLNDAVGRVAEVFGKLDSITSSLMFLKGPLEVIEAAIRPVEWALDAIQFVFDLIISPILNPILDALGVTALMKSVADSVAALLPDLAILDPVEAKIAEFEAAIGAPFESLRDAVGTFAGHVVRTLVLGPLGAESSESSDFLVGYDRSGPANSVASPSGNDIVAGGRGDDTLSGGAGRDILIGGAGNDRIDGAGDTDVAIFLGNFREFLLTFPAPSGDAGDATRIIVSHERPPGGMANQGADTVTNVEHFAFFDATFELSTLRNIQRSNSTQSSPGLLEGSDLTDILIGGAGVDTIRGNGGDDYIFGGGGPDILTGGPGADTFDGMSNDDRITDFSVEDRIVIANLHLARTAFSFGDGRLSFDTDGDGTGDAVIFLNGDFGGGEFLVGRSGDDSVVTFRRFLPELSEKTAVSADAVNGVVGQDLLTGDGTDTFRLTLKDAAVADDNNALGVYEVDPSGRIVHVRLLVKGARDADAVSVDITGVENGNRLGFFLVQNGGAFAAGLADGDRLTFTDARGAAANVFTPGPLRLAVNGVATAEATVHGFAPGLNLHGVQHALSGIEPGGNAVTIGFEDTAGGGDRDYQDVVFTVERVTPPDQPDNLQPDLIRDWFM
jgi:hypothetical protein